MNFARGQSLRITFQGLGDIYDGKDGPWVDSQVLPHIASGIALRAALVVRLEGQR